VTEAEEKTVEVLQIEVQVQPEHEIVVKTWIPEVKVVEISDKMIIETPTPKKEKKEHKSKNKAKK